MLSKMKFYVAQFCDSSFNSLVLKAFLSWVASFVAKEGFLKLEEDYSESEEFKKLQYLIYPDPKMYSRDIIGRVITIFSSTDCDHALRLCENLVYFETIPCEKVYCVYFVEFLYFFLKDDSFWKLALL